MMRIGGTRRALASVLGFNENQLLLPMISSFSGNDSISRLPKSTAASCYCSTVTADHGDSGITPAKPTTHDLDLENLIKTKCKSGNLNLDEALQFFSSTMMMAIQNGSNNKPNPSIWAFNQLLGTVYQMKHHAIVVSMYKQIMGIDHRGSRIKPDISTITILTNCFCHLGRGELGLTVLSVIFKRGLQPDPPVITALLRGLCANDKLPEAIRLFYYIVMENRRYRCDEFVCGVLVDALCKNGHSCEALMIVSKLLDRRQLKPNRAISNSLVHGLCKERQIDQALKLCQEMMNAGVALDMFAYNGLLHCLCDFGKWEEVAWLLHRMQGCGISPDFLTFSRMVESLCRARRKTEARKLVQVMAQIGLKPNVIIYTFIFRMLCHSGEPVKTTELRESTFSSLINALCKEKRIKKTDSIVEPLIQSGPGSDFVRCSTLLDGLCHSNQWMEIATVFKEMLDQGIYPDLQIFNVLLDGLCKDKMMEKAYELLEVMIQEGIKPDIITYNTFITGRCLLGEIDRARYVFDSMVSRGCAPTIASYNALISGYRRAGRSEEAQRLVEEIIQKFGLTNAVKRVVEARPSKSQS